MTPGVVALVMLAILVVAIMIGFPVAFTLMALGVGFGYYAYYQPGVDFFAKLFRMEAIARAHPRIVGLSLGAEDFALSVGMLPEPEGLFYPKQQAVFAARAAGILPLGFVGTVANYKDQDAFRAIVRRSRRLGFMGASAIHPLQIPVLNEELAPSAAEVETA